MRIVSKETMALYSGQTRCEYCKEAAWGGTQCHHIHTRGAGRLDIPCNLIGLCAGCHMETHAGLITRSDLLLMVAKRENVNQDSIEAVVFLLRRLDKHATDAAIVSEAKRAELNDEAKALLWRSLECR